MRWALLPAAVVLLATASRAESVAADANGSEDVGTHAEDEHGMLDNIFDEVDEIAAHHMWGPMSLAAEHLWTFERWLSSLHGDPDAEDNPVYRAKYETFIAKAKERHAESMKRHSFWELIKTVAGTSVGFCIMMALLVCCLGMACLGVNELIKHKAKRYIQEEGHSPFRRGAKRTVKVD